MPQSESALDNGTRSACSTEDTAASALAASSSLTQLPPELLDEIISHWEVIPLHYYSDTYNHFMLPRRVYAQRTLALRALSQTCRVLREICIPILWSRLETCWVPPKSLEDWHKYVMLELKRKAEGVKKWDNGSLRRHIRTLCFMTTSLRKSPANLPMPALRSVLPTLSNLTTIQVLHCDNASDIVSAMDGLILPSVRMVVVPTKCNFILKACPNVTHVRCAGGDGLALILALQFCSDLQILDGMIDWDLRSNMTCLILAAPKLHKLEIRSPVTWTSQKRSTTPDAWAEIIPRLSELPELRIIQLSFPGREHPSDSASIEASRRVLRTFKADVDRERKLIIRRVFAPHISNTHNTDFVETYTEESF